ncbi:MAG: TolC family protein, partial [Rhodothermia bacterium]
LQSDLVRVEHVLEDALDALKMLLGLPMEQPIVLRGNLDDVEPGRLVNVSLDDAVTRAVAQRLDLEQAALSIELQRINESIQKSARYPSLRGFVNAGYVGSVPSNRQVVFNTDDDFTFDSVNLGFFDGSYWFATASVGLTLQWKIFDGRQTHANIQRARIEQQRAEIIYEELLNDVKREIEAARREVFAAERRMTSQSRNVQRAELNYRYASTRLQEGVSSRLEERQASELLDDSRLNYNRALFDYLVAQADFETAVGNSIASTDVGMTSLMDSP